MEPEERKVSCLWFFFILYPIGIPPKSDLVFDIQLMQINDIDLTTSYAVTDIPELSPSLYSKLNLFAGHIQVNTWKYFHILVKSITHVPSKQPKSKILFWFNGGPGCSSMDGMFLENGPLRFNTSTSPPSLRINEKGWWKEIDLVYVDHPPGTGYSLGTFFDSTNQVVDNFETFLANFMEIYPMYQSSGIYLGGESFAGVWIPQIAKRLLKMKKPVKGLVLGNPWIDPLNQYPSILDYSQKLNLISEPWLPVIQEKQKTCIEDLKKVPRVNTYDHCEQIMSLILEASREGGLFCMNKYDYTLRDHGYFFYA
jgi:carboxypeptidase D